MTTAHQQRPAEVLGKEEACVYLPQNPAQMRYRHLPGCAAQTYQDLLERGWRRFGDVFFRPACRGCAECRSLRVDVAAFEPGRAMRRNRKHNRDLNVLIRRPTLTYSHLELYDRFHQDMEERRQWRRSRTSPEEYYQSFVAGHGTFGHEILFFEEQRLLAVSLVDLLPRAMSSVYTFYAPQERSRGLGVFSILTQVEWAQRAGIPYLYLGFCVSGNPSMSYKARYRPHEILAGRPELAEEPCWRPSPG